MFSKKGKLLNGWSTKLVRTVTGKTSEKAILGPIFVKYKNIKKGSTKNNKLLGSKDINIEHKAATIMISIDKGMLFIFLQILLQ